MRIGLYYSRISGESSEELLIRAAEMYSGFGADELEVCRPRIDGGWGKPYFAKHPEIRFSISHSGGIWICAIADSEVGADIQIHTPNRRCVELAERYFHADEAAAVRAADDAREDFFRLWARKEAVVKLFGCGIDGTFSSFDARGEVVMYCGEAVHLRDIELPFEEVHSACVATRCEVEVDLVRV